MKKQVVVLNNSEGYQFGYDGRNIIVSESMAISDAEHLQATYPGGYVDVIEVANEPSDTTPAKKAKTATTAE